MADVDALGEMSEDEVLDFAGAGPAAVPGIYVWRDPHGGFYLVDHTGTRRLPGTPANPNLGDKPRSPVAIELWHSPAAFELDYAA